jgi:hypothetical protein
MSDPLRTDNSRAPDESGADRDSKIEQLLLVGLDHYFAAEYDQAINVWTRALFLDRSHARARAYIERARSALAERQRQSEELLQHGVAAFERGEGPEARRLLQAALDGGAQADEALVVLDRLNRLENAAAGPTAQVRRAPRAALRGAASERTRGVGRAIAWALLAVVVAAMAAGAFVVAPPVDLSDWRALIGLQTTPAASTVSTARDAGLALPRRGETALVRARALAANHQLRDALKALDLIRVTDPQKADADLLRADVQRQLLKGDRHPQ